MKFKDFLIESPQLISGFDTSVFDERKTNIIEGGKFLRRLKETIRENDDSILFRTGMEHDGYFVFLDKKTNYVNYFIRFEFKKLDGVKRVTQVGIWKTDTPSVSLNDVKTITGDMFFNVLLKRYKTIASDKQQTNDGKRFWIRQMSYAVTANHKVGLLKVGTKEIEYYDKSKYDSIVDWVNDLEISWGRETHHQRYRFVIEE